MKTLCDYLNDAKKVTGSDYATAKRIEISRQALSEARKTGRISAETAVRLAEILEIEAIQIIAASEVQKAPEKAHFWAKFSAAFFCAFALILSSASNEINALESNTYNQNKAANGFNQSIYYAKLLQIADCRLQIADCRLQIADCRLQIADCIYGYRKTAINRSNRAVCLCEPRLCFLQTTLWANVSLKQPVYYVIKKELP